MRQFASMHPQEAARLLRGELEDALAHPSDGPARAVALTILPPADLAPDTAFLVRASLGRQTLEVDLPTGLAIGYLASACRRALSLSNTSSAGRPSPRSS